MGENGFSSWWCLWCKQTSFLLDLLQIDFYLKKALDTYEPPTIPDQKRSLFDTTYIWHATALGDNGRRRAAPAMIGESKNESIQLNTIHNCWSLDLKSAFDERSIFPKYILDYEAKQRQLFESANQPQTTLTAGGAGGNNPNSQPHTRQPTEAQLRSKRQSLASIFSDARAQWLWIEFISGHFFLQTKIKQTQNPVMSDVH